MEKTKINSLAELQAEQARIRRNLELTEAKIWSQLSLIQHQLPGFLAKKALLPAGAIGLVGLGVKKAKDAITRKVEGSPVPNEIVHPPAAVKWLGLTPVVLKALDWVRELWVQRRLGHR